VEVTGGPHPSRTKEIIMLELPLSALRVGATNVRADTDIDENLKTLIASIRSVGLLQPLVVTKVDDKHFDIVAGRRRFHALNSLVNDGHPIDTVPCLEVDEKIAAEASLAENYAREAMSTRELYTAFSRMRAAGQDDAAIAAAFGWDEKRVTRVMRLATLADPVRDAWFAGELDDGQAQAFAFTDKHNIQTAVFERLGNQYRAQGIRGEIVALLGGEANSRELTFVGLDAYLKAGGKVEQDLFTDAVAILDAPLLHKLATKKLETEKKALAKQLGVKIDWKGEPPTCNQYGYNSIDYACRVPFNGEERYASEEDETRAVELDALFESDGFDATDDDEQQKLYDEAEQIQDRKVTVPAPIKAERVIGARAGISYGGKFEYELFYASREEAGLPPIIEKKRDDDEGEPLSSVFSRSSPPETPGTDRALANKKAMGASKDSLMAMQVIFADVVATETVIASEAGNPTGLDALLFVLARAVVNPYHRPPGSPDIRLGANGEGRGPHKVRKLAGDKIDLALILNNPEWLTQHSTALAYDDFKDWVANEHNRLTLGAALLGCLWHPLGHGFAESNKPQIVELVAEDMDPGPNEWAGRFDRRKVADLLSHKARVEALNSFGMADHAKALKKATSTDFLMKVLDADSEQRKLWDIDEETGAVIESWLPIELEVRAVERPMPGAKEVEDAPLGAIPQPDEADTDSEETLEDA
jgi:ParB family chromosome partitioning protein